MSSNIFEEFIICDICFETFNENDRRPRVLSCGHSFCCSCLESLQANNPSCPNCKAVIQYSQPDLIPVNFSFENLIQKFNNKTRKLESNGYCKQHDHHKEFRCMDCNIWACGTCIALHHKSCDTILVQDFRALKRQTSQQIAEELETRERDSTNGLVEALNQEKLNLIVVIKLKQDELQDCENRIKEANIQLAHENEFCEKLKNIQIIVDDPSRDEDFLRAKNELDSLLEQGRCQDAQLTQQLSLLPMTLESLTFLGPNESIYAKLDDKSAMYGEVMMKNGEIWIFSFQTEKPQAKLISFNKLLSKFTGSTKMPNKVFLQLSLPPEFGYEEESFDVIIKADGDPSRATNLIYLCSALKIKTYKGLQLICKDGCSASFQISINGAPYPVVIGIRKNSPNNKCLTSEGLVYGMNHVNSWCAISLTNNPFGGDFVHKIGVVVSGLPKLKEVMESRREIKDLLIKECGLVI